MLTDDEIGEKFDKFIDEGWEENIKGDNEDEPDEIDKKSAIRLARWAYEKGKEEPAHLVCPACEKHICQHSKKDMVEHQERLIEQARASAFQEGIDAVEREPPRGKGGKNE